MNTWHLNKKDPDVRKLAAADPVIGELIELIDDVSFQLRPNLFRSLVRSIVGQLISVAAAEAIFNRLDQAVDGLLNAQTLSRLSDQTILECGFSKRKLQYLRGLQNHVLTGKLDLEALSNYDNQAIIKQLTDVKGIGKWTAQMFLIFSLQRKDVLAIDDIGLQRGAKWLYQVDNSECRQALIRKGKNWTPYATIASIYLWEAVQIGWVNTYQTIAEAKRKSMTPE